MGTIHQQCPRIILRPHQGGVRVVSAQTAHCSPNVTTKRQRRLTKVSPPQDAFTAKLPTFSPRQRPRSVFRSHACSMTTFFALQRLRLLAAALLTLAASPGTAAPDTAPLASSHLGAPVPLPASLAWGWPLAGVPAVVHGFDPPAQPWLSGHRGVDLAAPQGVDVLAPVAGVVTFSGVVVNREVLTIAVSDGLRLSLEPVTSPLKAGDSIARGQIVGVVEGPTHCDHAGSGVTSCLHWGVRRGEEYLDPLQFILDLRPSVLLPLNN